MIILIFHSKWIKLKMSLLFAAMIPLIFLLKKK